MVCCAVSAYISALVTFTCFVWFFSLIERFLFFHHLYRITMGQKHGEQTEKLENVLVTKLKKTFCVQLCACAVGACALTIVFFKAFQIIKKFNFVFRIAFGGQMKKTGRHQFNGNFFSSFIWQMCHQIFNCLEVLRLILISQQIKLDLYFAQKSLQKNCCVQAHFARKCNATYVNIETESFTNKLNVACKLKMVNNSKKKLIVCLQCVLKIYWLK